MANKEIGNGVYTFALAFLQFTQAFRVMESGTRRRLETKGPRSRPLPARCLRRGPELVDSDVDWLGLLAEALLSATDDGLMVRRATFSKPLRGIA